MILELDEKENKQVIFVACHCESPAKWRHGIAQCVMSTHRTNVN